MGRQRRGENKNTVAVYSNSGTAQLVGTRLEGRVDGSDPSVLVSTRDCRVAPIDQRKFLADHAAGIRENPRPSIKLTRVSLPNRSEVTITSPRVPLPC